MHERMINLDQSNQTYGDFIHDKLIKNEGRSCSL